MNAIEISECVHCNSLVLNASGEQCPCGGELYPVRKVVPSGTRIINATMDNVISENNETKISEGFLKQEGSSDILADHYAKLENNAPPAVCAYACSFEAQKIWPIEFVLRLMSPGPRKIEVMKAIREYFAWDPKYSLKWIKDIVDNRGSVLRAEMSFNEAKDLTEKLEALGATVEAIPTSWDDSNWAKTRKSTEKMWWRER